MEILAILFWSVVLTADVAFMTQIPRLVRDFERWLDRKQKAPGRTAMQAKGIRHMTDAVYHFTHKMSKEVDPMTKAIIIRTSGDPQLCAQVGEAFESPKLRAMRLQNTVLKRDRDTLRQMELNAIRREVGAYISRHQRARKLRAAFWAQVSRLGLFLTKGGAKA